MVPSPFPLAGRCCCCFQQLRCFSGHGGRRTNSSRSLPRQFKGSFHPEVLNRKVYWWSEHKPVRRTVYTLLNNHFEVKLFSQLCSHPSMAPTAWAHELTSAGPFTAFLPTDAAMQKCHPASMQKLYDNADMLKQFVKHHFVMGHWKFRDLIGSCVQPWKVYNHDRPLPSCISTMAEEPLEVTRLQPHSPQLMDLTLVRAYHHHQQGSSEEPRMVDHHHHHHEEEEEVAAASVVVMAQQPGPLSTAGGGLGVHDWQQLVRLGENSRIYRTEMRCHNGIVHLIDSPLIPPSWRMSTKEEEDDSSSS
eukprot:GHVS01022461.1.p1 GENE.GHVS01022461.1~~GHVS01022461.1.p1  ORF type:complete len:304 (-),score=75.36 GHVS01022461.1:50-961(-)